MSDTSNAQLLSRGVEDIIVRSELEKKLKGSKKLRVKFGIDPTGDRIHIGHAVVYWKLREFQDLGHKVIILIGDYTATIGDHSDKTAERQPLTPAQVKANMKSYLDQIGHIVNLKKAEIRYNSEWLGKMGVLEFVDLARQFKVAQMIARDNFKQRFEADQPIGLDEFLYPALQGYDSVALKADVELGGNDQLFNMMAGRTLQKRDGQPPQAVMTLELLVGPDGKKMSKSQPNCIFVTDQPLDIYGKVMTVEDKFIPHYFRLATDAPLEVVEQVEHNMAAGDNPRDTKASLARAIVARYYDDKIALEAEEAWDKQFREGGQPDEIETITVTRAKTKDIIALVSEVFSLSKSEVRRLIEQGGVRVNDDVIKDPAQYQPSNDMLIQVGKRRYKRIVIDK